MDSEQDAPVIIELDDPAPRAAGLIGVIVIIAVLAIFLAPFLVTTHPAFNASEEQALRPPDNPPICQPQFDVPKFLEPVTHVTLPGFMRLCNWLVPLDAPDPSFSPNDWTQTGSGVTFTARPSSPLRTPAG